jgi:hypothetical protein
VLQEVSAEHHRYVSRSKSTPIQKATLTAAIPEAIIETTMSAAVVQDIRIVESAE